MRYIIAGALSTSSRPSVVSLPLNAFYTELEDPGAEVLETLESDQGVVHARCGPFHFDPTQIETFNFSTV